MSVHVSSSSASSSDFQILGIDQGTTGTRAVVMNASGTIVASAYRKHRQIHPKLADGTRGCEHDADEIWLNTRWVIEKVARGRPIAALGIANQGETVMLWDRASGKPLHNAIVWQDNRTRQRMAEIRADARLRELVECRTGLRPDPYFSASKIEWLLEHAPSARAALEAGTLCAGTLDAWLIFKLTDGAVFATDTSTAARTLLFDIHRRAYSPELLDLFGVSPSILPEVREAPFGTVSSIPALRGVAIAASLVDQPSAMFGQGCLGAGDAKATYGTGCFVYVNSGHEPPRPADGILGTIAWTRGRSTTYALDGGVFSAGSVVEYLTHTLRILRRVSDLDSVLEATPSVGSVLCVPAFTGLAAPFWKRDAHAAFLGIDLATDRGALVRAALEGVALRVAQVIRAMNKSLPEPISRLRVDGGLARSSRFLQLQADCLGLPLDVLDTPEASVMGVCYLAARNMGLWADDSEIRRRIAVARTVEPASNSAASRIARLERFDVACDLISKWRPQ